MQRNCERIKFSVGVKEIFYHKQNVFERVGCWGKHFITRRN